jgi:hypothetical protein
VLAPLLPVVRSLSVHFLKLVRAPNHGDQNEQRDARVDDGQGQAKRRAVNAAVRDEALHGCVNWHARLFLLTGGGACEKRKNENSES